MADHAPPLTSHGGEIRLESQRVDTFLKTLEEIASGQVDARLPVSPHHDALDALADAINAVVGALGSARAQAAKTAELRAAIASAEERHGAMLRAIPDLMFVLQRDGVYVDYYARDSKMLFVSPSAFIGRSVREILPPTVAALMMNGLERACRSDDPVVIE
jgi:PAS domain-containing protein